MSFQLTCMVMFLALLQVAMGSRPPQRLLYSSLRQAPDSFMHTSDTFHQEFTHQEYDFTNSTTAIFDSWRSAVSHEQILNRPYDTINQSGLPVNLTFRIEKTVRPLPLSPLRTLFSSRQLNHQEHVLLNTTIEKLQLYVIVILLAVWISLEAAKILGHVKLNDESRKNNGHYLHSRGRRMSKTRWGYEWDE